MDLEESASYLLKAIVLNTLESFTTLYITLKVFSACAIRMSKYVGFHWHDNIQIIYEYDFNEMKTIFPYKSKNVTTLVHDIDRY